MSLEMQMRRGIFALVIGLAVAGLALGRASLDTAGSGPGVGAVIRAVDTTNPGCDAYLRIELAYAMSLTLPCGQSCAQMRRVLHTLHVAAQPRPHCGVVHTA